MANFNFNKVMLGGRLVAEPELKQTPNGIPVCSFSLAVNRKANRQETDFISCVAWRQAAEFLNRYFHKGSSVFIVGAIQTRTWTDSNNQKRTTVEIVVEEINFVDGKGDSKPSASAEASAFTQSTDESNTMDELEVDDTLPF